MSRYALILSIVLFPAQGLAAETQPAADNEAKKLLDKALKQYRSARSYQDEYIQDVKLEGAGTDRLSAGAQSHQKLVFAAPNKFALTSPEYRIACDGQKILEQISPIEQYVERPAPPRIDLKELAIQRFPKFDEDIHPIAPLLTDEKADFSKAIGEIREYKDVKSETRAGVAGKTLSGIVSTNLGGGPSVDVPFTVWFNAAGLMEEIAYDYTKQIQEQLKLQGAEQAGIHLTRFQQRKRFVSPVLNGTPAADAFALTKSEFDRKVTRFEPVSPEELQQRMVGRPAPSFKTTDLEGKPASLSDFKGKVVLLDFWATTCGPCIMAMPQLQKLAEKYAKQQVAIMGVNGDALPPPPTTQPGTTALAERFRPLANFIKGKKLTYLQFADPEGQISSSYRISAIPSVILIDQKGIVRRIHNGYSPNAAEVFAGEIDLLLKGKTLPVEELGEAQGG